jgi:hypothetical protein
MKVTIRYQTLAIVTSVESKQELGQLTGSNAGAIASEILEERLNKVLKDAQLERVDE